MFELRVCWFLFVQCHVMFGSDIVSDLKNIIDEEDLAVVMRSKNHPRCVVEFISRSIQLLQIEEAKRCVMVNAALTISFISAFYGVLSELLSIMMGFLPL